MRAGLVTQESRFSRLSRPRHQNSREHQKGFYADGRKLAPPKPLTKLKTDFSFVKPKLPDIPATAAPCEFEMHADTGLGDPRNCRGNAGAPS